MSRLENVRLRRIESADRDELAQLIHTSLDVWHRTRLGIERFGTEWEPFRTTVDVYAALDPGCCVVATNETGKLIGSAFFHPRETHVGVGVVSVHPSVFGCGVGRALMEEIIRIAAGQPLRLVSSAMNLDSFSLYTRLGFVPQMTLQAVTLEVPVAGLPGPSESTRVRAATGDDVAAMAELEFRLNGVRKEHDYRFFVENESRGWRLSVIESPTGALTGFLAASAHPSDQLLGPGVAEEETAMQALVHAMFDRHFRGKRVVWLIPVGYAGLVRQAYSWGAKNRETHLFSVLGLAPAIGGITIPTFLPESG